MHFTAVYWTVKHKDSKHSRRSCCQPPLMCPPAPHTHKDSPTSTTVPHNKVKRAEIQTQNLQNGIQTKVQSSKRQQVGEKCDVDEVSDYPSSVWHGEDNWMPRGSVLFMESHLWNTNIFPLLFLSVFFNSTSLLPLRLLASPLIGDAIKGCGVTGSSRWAPKLVAPLDERFLLSKSQLKRGTHILSLLKKCEPHTWWEKKSFQAGSGGKQITHYTP